MDLYLKLYVHLSQWIHVATGEACVVLHCLLTELSFVVQLMNKTVYYGDPQMVEFKCEFSVWDEAVTWYKDGRVIQHDGDKYYVGDAADGRGRYGRYEREGRYHKLIMYAGSADHAGQYSAVFNSNISTTATLTVKG